jgi:CRP/FNR family cyclic AMP-dependent transcriptional regulator
VAPRSVVHVLDHDPDLAEHLGPEDFDEARDQLIARVVRFPRGDWTIAPQDIDGSEDLGLLLIDGLLIRKVTVGHRTCAELLGPGDVTQPWLRAGPDASVGTEVNWQVARALRLALLDREFLLRASRWPAISAAISRRMMLRVHWLSFHLAVCHLRRLDDRLLLVLWHLADRWGRVTPRGIEIELPLTHSLLAAVVGAHRPSVTNAVRRLADAGLIEPRSRARWILHGDPPAELQGLHDYATHRERPEIELAGG